MDFKKAQKSISRFFGWFSLVTVSLIIKLIPSKGRYAFAQAIAKVGYSLVGRQRKIALESLHMAFAGEKSEEEICSIAQDCFTFMAKSAIEVMTLMDKPELLDKRISFTHKEYLDEALSRGRGVILVSAHFGNFPLLLARLARAGYKTSGIMRPMRDARVEKIFLEKRNRYGVTTIYSQPRNTCVTQTLQMLRGNGIVFIPIDQNFGTAGVFVDFFGRKAATATGPVVLAQRTGAELLPCFIIRQKDDTHLIAFEPALKLVEAKDSAETVRINIQSLTDIIERYIRRYPAEWGWIHRRWKSKPN
jgi:KDO2-lipid IV(A) lauroyltransferase